MTGFAQRCRAAARTYLNTMSLLIASALTVSACGGAPCEAMVNKQIQLVEASGSAAEKATVQEVKSESGAREGLIEVCAKLAKRDGTFAAKVSCQAKAGDLGAFKACAASNASR